MFHETGSIEKCHMMFHYNNPIQKQDIIYPNQVADFIIDQDHEYLTPLRTVKMPREMLLWIKSECYYEYYGFILYINESLIGKTTIEGSENPSKTVQTIVRLLEKIDAIYENYPPASADEESVNPAFAMWYRHLKTEAFEFLKRILPENLHRAIPEIMAYLVDSFGNPETGAYGICNEISFTMLLCCFYKIGVLREKDRVAVPCLIFNKYLQVCWKVQEEYSLASEESLGVWGLDDFQFVPFIWGSAQLINRDSVIRPATFLIKEKVDMLVNESMFMNCIQHIFKVNRGVLAEHHNQLWGVSGVQNWSKVNEGLLRMYKREILWKFQFVQHFLFGSLMTLLPAESEATVRRTRLSLEPLKSLEHLDEEDSDY